MNWVILVMKKNAGFSLIELMVVVGIIGILASLALPKFTEFQAKARQSEAKTNLNYISTLEEAYASDNTVYLPFAVISRGTAAVCTGASDAANALGFAPSPCDMLLYNYAVALSGTTGYDATAREHQMAVFMCRGSAVVDTWVSNESRAIRHTMSGMCN